MGCPSNHRGRQSFRWCRKGFSEAEKKETGISTKEELKEHIICLAQHQQWVCQTRGRYIPICGNRGKWDSKPWDFRDFQGISLVKPKAECHAWWISLCSAVKTALGFAASCCAQQSVQCPIPHRGNKISNKTTKSRLRCWRFKGDLDS